MTNIGYMWQFLFVPVGKSGEEEILLPCRGVFCGQKAEENVL